jgi:glycosyltransferase involved in cell wall biosynthesis
LALYANIEGLVFLGHVNDIPALWTNCHVAVLPSRREGLPKSLLEAAACGRPLLASDVPGCREIVLHGDNGLLFEVDNPAALADAMEVMIADPALRLEMGQCGRQMVEDRFSSRSIGAATVAVYQRALARKA